MLFTTTNISAFEFSNPSYGMGHNLFFILFPSSDGGVQRGFPFGSLIILAQRWRSPKLDNGSKSRRRKKSASKKGKPNEVASVKEKESATFNSGGKAGSGNSKKELVGSKVERNRIDNGKTLAERLKDSNYQSIYTDEDYKDDFNDY